MTISAQSIIRRCVDTLQDKTSIRWPVAELVRYLNDGQREVILHRPDALDTRSSITLVAGTKQTLPSTGSKLIDILCNTGGTKRSIRIVNREILDAQVDNWHALTGVTEIVHYMYDPRTPRTFHVFPPAASSGAAVEAVYSAYPTDITEPSAGAEWSGVAGNISLPDVYSNVLQDYILARAFSKDAEYAQNAGRAQNHYAMFANALGIELKGTVGVAPQSPGNPNVRAAA